MRQFIEAFRVYFFLDDKEVLLLPKGVFEMVFQSQHSFQHNTYYSEGWQLRPRNFIGGLHNKSYFVNSGTKENYCVVVEFKPNTAKFFIPEKLNQFKNSIVDIYDIWGKSAQRLVQKIDRSDSEIKKIEYIESFLISKFIPSETSIIDVALQNIISNKGFAQIDKLSQEAYLSPAQFRKRFKEEVGISPSQYRKIVRVNASLEMLKNEIDSLTDLSYSLGYYDQSHFIKDFKNIIGLSPSKYLSQQA